MCGIMGYYSFGKTIPDKDKITNMFSLLESRGRDASGFAFIRDNNLIVHKDAIKSPELVKTDDWKELVLPSSMILHTRMKTQGSEKNPQNNHPLFSKNGIAIVHNGIIYNDKEIFGKKQRDAEVDSESILHLLSMKIRGDKIKRLFDRIEGSFAVAVLDRNDPEKLRRDSTVCASWYVLARVGALRGGRRGPRGGHPARPPGAPRKRISPKGTSFGASAERDGHPSGGDRGRGLERGKVGAGGTAAPRDRLRSPNRVKTST